MFQFIFDHAFYDVRLFGRGKYQPTEDAIPTIQGVKLLFLQLFHQEF